MKYDIDETQFSDITCDSVPKWICLSFDWPPRYSAHTIMSRINNRIMNPNLVIIYQKLIIFFNRSMMIFHHNYMYENRINLQSNPDYNRGSSIYSENSIIIGIICHTESRSFTKTSTKKKRLLNRKNQKGRSIPLWPRLRKKTVKLWPHSLKLEFWPYT